MNNESWASPTKELKKNESSALPTKELKKNGKAVFTNGDRSALTLQLPSREMAAMAFRAVYADKLGTPAEVPHLNPSLT